MTRNFFLALFAGFALAATGPARAASDVSQPSTRNPFATRLRAIGSPIIPSPMNPTGAAS